MKQPPISQSSILNPRKGQALVEAIIAGSVLIVALIGVYGLLASSMHLNRTVTDNYTATYLAAEGIEVVKNIIDHNFILRLTNPAQSWYAGLGNGNFEVDYSSQALTLFVPPGRKLSYNPASGLYSYSGSLPTNFVRRINITLNPGAGGTNSVTVTSRVNWSTGIVSNYSVALTDMFFNWRP